jgi:arylsulfatase A-like enzyme
MLERADEGIGRILAALDQQGLSRNTLVMFTSDNGGDWLSSNAPLSHRKSTLWEGGIRVPLIQRWPARLPVGKTSEQVAITMDLTTTILAATALDEACDSLTIDNLKRRELTDAEWRSIATTVLEGESAMRESDAEIESLRLRLRHDTSATTEARGKKRPSARGQPATGQGRSPRYPGERRPRRDRVGRK